MNHKSQDDLNVHHRHSIRLQGYDYSQEGMYHVVVRTKNGVCVFGDIVANEIRFSPIGEIAQKCWLEIPQHFKRATLDVFQVMPNHIHGILILHEKSPALVRVEYIQEKDISRKGFIHETPTGKGLINQTPTKNISSGWPLMKDHRITLGKIVRFFKAKCSKIVHDVGYSDFAWQRDYYDHIIRDGADLDRIRRYIIDNPVNWVSDDDYPKNVRMDPMHLNDEDWSALD